MPDDRQYEFVYVLAPTVANAEVETLQRELAEHIGKVGGAVENTDLWGRRKLAYPIGNFTEGIYVVQLIRGPGAMVTELERRMRVHDDVLRYLTVRVDDDLRKAQRAAEKRKADAERRRAARGAQNAPAPPAGPAGDAPTDGGPAADGGPRPEVTPPAAEAEPSPSAPAEAKSESEPSPAAAPPRSEDAPAESAPAPPAESASTPPAESAPAPPAESASAPPAESAPAPPAESAPAPPAESASAEEPPPAGESGR